MFRLDGEVHLFEFTLPLVLSAARQLGLGLTRRQNDIGLLYLAEEALQEEYSEDTADAMRLSASAELSARTVEQYSRLVSERRSTDEAVDSPSHGVLSGMRSSSLFTATGADKPGSPSLKGRASAPIPVEVSYRHRRSRRRGTRAPASFLACIVEEDSVEASGSWDAGSAEEVVAAFSSDDEDCTEEGSSSSGSGSEADGGCADGVAQSATGHASQRPLMTFGDFLSRAPSSSSSRRKQGVSLLLRSDLQSLKARPGKDHPRQSRAGGTHPSMGAGAPHTSLAEATLAASTRSLAGTTRRAAGAARGPLLSMLEGADWSAAAGASSPVAGF